MTLDEPASGSWLFKSSPPPARFVANTNHLHNKTGLSLDLLVLCRAGHLNTYTCCAAQPAGQPEIAGTLNTGSGSIFLTQAEVV